MIARLLLDNKTLTHLDMDIDQKYEEVLLSPLPLPAVLPCCLLARARVC